MMKKFDKVGDWKLKVLYAANMIMFDVIEYTFYRLMENFW